LSSLPSRLASLDRRVFGAVAAVVILLLLAVGGTRVPAVRRPRIAVAAAG
jgi:hypothetical protein